MLATLHRFFGTWRFPALAGTALVSSVLAMGAVLAVPTGPGPLGDFAEDFKIWCFGYDPATGEIEMAYVVVFLVQPLVLAGIVFAMWWDTFRGVPARTIAPWVSAAVVCVVASVAATGALGAPAREGELPFPAEELRTSFAAPDLTLVDHTGKVVSLADLRGKVVLLTAVYARCGGTCPTILAQARAAAAEVGAVDDFRVLAVTLDAAHDTPEVLAGVARAQGLATPPWHLLSGEPARVEAALDDLGVARKRDPVSGVIDHTNLFVLVDRQGRVAYRFTLGERQRRWLVAAIQLLLREETS